MTEEAKTALHPDVLQIQATTITTEDTTIREDQKVAETVTEEAQTALHPDVLQIQTTTITIEDTTIRADRKEAATEEVPAIHLQDQEDQAEIPEVTEISSGMKTEDSHLQREADSEAEATEEAEIRKIKIYRPAA